jgi:hypothetical protein
VIKLLVGLLKGAVIGGAISYGAYAVHFDFPWLVYGVVGVLVGLVAGRPIWSLFRDKNATSVVAMLRAAFGFGIGCGLYALVNRFVLPATLDVGGIDVFTWPIGLGIGALWGGFLELDDSVGGDPDKADKGKGDGDAKTRPTPAPKQLKK